MPTGFRHYGWVAQILLRDLVDPVCNSFAGDKKAVEVSAGFPVGISGVD
jgi:hypothetical protein